MRLAGLVHLWALCALLLSACASDDEVTPCAECSSAAWACTTPGWHEAAEFRLTSSTASSCSGVGTMVAGTISIDCDKKELCNGSNCEAYTFDGTNVVAPSGLKCKLTHAPP